MIKELDPIKHTDNLYDRNGFITNVACGGVIISKVNELIDAVNELQKYLQPIKVKAPDPFARQRKWIGKLCRFWDAATDKGTYGILTDIKDDRYVCPNGMFMCNRIRYKHCEPISPDDDVIYKKD